MAIPHARMRTINARCSKKLHKYRDHAICKRKSLGCAKIGIRRIFLEIELQSG